MRKLLKYCTQKIGVNALAQDIEGCHRIGKSKNNSKKTIICFINRKYAKKVLLNRKGLRNIGRSSIGLLDSSNIIYL